MWTPQKKHKVPFEPGLIARIPGLFSLSSDFARGESVFPFSDDFPVSLQGSTVDSKKKKKKKKTQLKNNLKKKNAAHQSCTTHFSASFDWMTALFFSKRTLFGWQMAPSLWRATRFCFAHLLFSLLSWPCPLRCQLPSQVLDLHWRSAEGGGGKTNQTGQQQEKEESG